MKSKIINGSIILLIGFGMFNFFNFLYQSIMARMLSVADYGILASLGAIIYIFTIFSESIQTIVAKYTVIGKDNERIKNLLKRGLKRCLKLSSLFFVGYLAVSLIVWKVLDISYPLLVLNGLLLYIVFMLPVTRGIMQGMKKFTQLSVSLVLESVFKIIIGVAFVFAGMKVYGAIGGFLMGMVIAFILSFIPLREVLKSREKHFNLDNIYSYAKPATFATAIVVIFSSIDILIAQAIFSSEDAGAYSIASMLGKIVMWVAVPIGKAMFPLSAESNENPIRSRKIFRTALMIIGLLVCGGILFFWLFPDFTVRIFSGKALSGAAEILPYLSVAFGLVAFANLILLYKLSLGDINGHYWLVACIAIELVLFFAMPHTMLSFSMVFILSAITLLIGSIFVKNKKSIENRHV